MTEGNGETFLKITHRDVYNKLCSLEQKFDDHLSWSQKQSAVKKLHLAGLWSVVTLITGVVVTLLLR